MDRGAWQATVHRVTKSWTQLKLLNTHACMRVDVVGIDRSLGVYRNVRVKGETSAHLILSQAEKCRRGRVPEVDGEAGECSHQGRNAPAPSPRGNQAEGGIRLVNGKVVVDTEQEPQWKLVCSRLRRKD